MAVDFLRFGLFTGATALVVSNNVPTVVKFVARIAKRFMGDLVQICNGVDDDVEINAAIDAVAANGGKVLLSNGTFTTASSITIPNYVTLQGQGWSTIIDCDAAPAVVAIRNLDQIGGNSGIILRDFKLDVVATSNTEEAMELLTADAAAGVMSDCLVERIWVVGVDGGAGGTVNPIIVGSTARTAGAALSDNMRIKECRVETCRGGLRLKLCKKSVIDHCYMNTTKYGAFIQTSSYLCKVTECIVDTPYNMGVAIESSCDECTLSGNIVDGSVSASGINVEQTCTNIRVEGNVAVNCASGTGIRMSAVTGGGQIIGNKAYGCRVGLFCGSSTNISITGNVSQHNDRQGLAIKESQGIVVAGNVLEDNSQAGAGSYSGIELNNDVGDPACTGVGITGNRISGANHQYGIEEIRDSDYNFFRDNDIRDYNTAPIYVLGSHTMVDKSERAITLMDLSGGVIDQEVYHAVLPCQLVAYTLVYTEASSVNAGVNVRVGRYADGVALDDDYFDLSVSEVSKGLGYAKHFVTGDLTQSIIPAGSTVTAGTAGAKVGTGEVLVILHIAEMS